LAEEIAKASFLPGPRILAEFWIPVSLHKLSPQRFASSSEQAVYSERFKLILANDLPAELYDLDRDPAEANNLLMSRPADATAVIEAYFRPLPKLPTEKGRRRASTPQALPEALRSLGYLQ
jgi:hypothetical protein